MKGRIKIISYALLLIIAASCNTSKRRITFKTHIDSDLKEYVDEFILEGSKRGFNAKPYIKIIDSIRVNHNMEYGFLGLYTPKTDDDLKYFYGTVDISPINKKSSTLLKRTVFHELAHVCGYRGHSCNFCPDILSSVTPLNVGDASKDSVMWNNKVDVLFEQIKAIPIQENPIRRYIIKRNIE